MNIKPFPLITIIETQKILKKTITANRALVLQEAKESSEIENIITTHDELFRASSDIESIANVIKEVHFVNSGREKYFIY